MTNPGNKLERELDVLISQGDSLLPLINPNQCAAFWSDYQGWYTAALPAVRSLAPDRLDDFRSQYCPQNRRGVDPDSYVLEDYVRGRVLSRSHDIAAGRFHTQLKILMAAKDQLSSTLANIRGLLQADLFDSELDAARELRRNGYLRAAGAIAGVVVEGHLKELCQKHQIKSAKRKPTLDDYNQALKDASVFDIPTWRGIQRLTDIRNYCDHKKDRDPTPDEVDELIDGADKATKTLN